MKLHVLEGYIQQIYLVEEESGLMLLDGCCRADVGVVLRYIAQELELPLSALKVVIVTHMHPDHAGGASRLRELTGCKLFGSNIAGQWYQGIDGYFMHLTDMALARWVGNRKGNGRKKVRYPRFIKLDHLLDDGDSIKGFEDWQALFTQGHTDRDLSILHIPSKTLYIADLLVMVKGRLIPPFPVFYPNRYKRSIARLAELDVEHILLAHGGKKPKSAIDFELLDQISPTEPQTHWRSVKKKFLKAVS
ncbi:MBL fold metallo-hydrolase [Vibrio ishigakensis]|uniref:MBL fold metallo-hydrolase n=1 Tax=Vibrio ishigakensis TaxID=1481914 RepID=UPI0021C45059|nr:MBL fold metallo-hydrolase [Vibrio ishigakensis]